MLAGGIGLGVLLLVVGVGAAAGDVPSGEAPKATDGPSGEAHSPVDGPVDTQLPEEAPGDDPTVSFISEALAPTVNGLGTGSVPAVCIVVVDDDEDVRVCLTDASDPAISASEDTACEGQRLGESLQEDDDQREC